MRYLFYLILLIESLSILITVIKYIIYLNKRDKLKVHEAMTLGESDYHLNVIIPVLREQSVIEDTLEYFESIIDKENTTLYVVTTEKEGFEKKISLTGTQALVNDLLKNMDIDQIVSKYNKLLPTAKLKELYSMKNNYRNKEIEFNIVIRKMVEECPTTMDILKNSDVIKSNDNIKILHYEETNGMMAHQLNYAIDVIVDDISSSRIKSLDKNYCVIYNADSTPNKDTFTEIDETIIRNNFPEVIQQYSLNLSNIDEIPNIMKGFAIYQSAFEVRNGLLNSISPLLYSHVVGHGLIIRLDTILDLDKFTTSFWCEDIYLTGAIANKGINIIPLDTMENAETPESIALQIKQSSNWFKTASHHFKMAKDIKNKQGKLSLNGIIWLLSEIKATFMWLFFPIFILFTFIYPIVVGIPEFLLTSVLAYLIFVYINYFHIVRSFYKKELSILSAIYVAAALMLTNLGPFYSFISKEKHKTPR